MTDKITFQDPTSRRVGLLADNAYIEQKASQWAAEDHEKLILLCQQHGIKAGPHMFYTLALELARELHPEPKKRGRKSKWTEQNKGMLVAEIERLVTPNDSSHGIEWACTQLAKREPWASFIDAKEGGLSDPAPAKALRKIYFESRNHMWAAICRDAFKFHEHEDTLAEWESLVSDSVNNLHPN